MDYVCSILALTGITIMVSGVWNGIYQEVKHKKGKQVLFGSIILGISITIIAIVISVVFTESVITDIIPSLREIINTSFMSICWYAVFLLYDMKCTEKRYKQIWDTTQAKLNTGERLDENDWFSLRCLLRTPHLRKKYRNLQKELLKNLYTSEFNHDEEAKSMRKYIEKEYLPHIYCDQDLNSILDIKLQKRGRE